VLTIGACFWVAADLAGCGHGSPKAAAPTAQPAPAAAPAAQAAPAATALEGAWLGTLHLGIAGELRLVLKVRRQGTALSATFDSVDQQAADIPIDTVAFDGAALTLRSSRIQATFEARLVGETLSGTFRQRGTELPLVLTKTANPPTVRPRPQQPARPLPYDELAVSVDGPSHNRLACTLTKPRGPGPFAAVVLITGSGPQNRDEAIAGHRPFLVLADAITRHGIAVLRCDDRGVGGSGGVFETATTFDFVEDALAELAVLRARSDVDPARVGLAGHSEGALIAPIAAVRSTDVKFVVLLAPPAVQGDQTLHLQSAAILKANGASDAQIAAAKAVNREAFAIVAAAPDGAIAAEKLRARAAALPKAARDALEQQMKQLTSPWLHTFLTLDPRGFLRKLRVPVLAVFGERDVQVLADPNLPELRRALRDNPDVTVRPMPGLNHLFQTCKTGLPDEYARIDETMSPAVLTLVTEWLEARLPRR
jgi:pimeloyl-ACP methyl ester carboxylesterase